MSVNYSVVSADSSADIVVDMRELLEGLSFGVFEDGKLSERVPVDDEELVVYDSERIGRGISVEVTEEGFDLRMLSPDCEEEIDLFFDLIERISGFGDCKILEEGETEVPLSELPEKKKYYKEFNRSTLMKFIGTDSNGVMFAGYEEAKTIELYCAKFALNMDRETAEKIAAAEDTVTAFGNWLHGCQSTDADYVTPAFFNTAKGLSGIFIIRQDRQSIVPVKPVVPFGYTDDNGDPVKADNWAAVYYSNGSKSITGAADYEDFIEAVGEISRPFDGARVTVGEISPEEAERIFTKERSEVFGE